MTKARLTFIAFFLFLVSCLFITVQIRATNSPNSQWQWTDTSSCIASQCGTVHGTKNQSGICVSGGGTNTCFLGSRTCNYVCPAITWQTSRLDCPRNSSAYTSHDDKKPCDWTFGSGSHKYKQYADKITETFGPIDITYIEKENKCHRPIASKVWEQWVIDNYNRDNPELLEKKEEDCHNIPAETTTRVSNCEDAIVTPCISDAPSSCPSDTTTLTPPPSDTITPPPSDTITPESSATATPVPTSEPSNNESSDDNSTSSSNNSAPPVCSDPNPGSPQNLQATYLGNGQVRLDWAATFGPHTSYAVAYGPSIGSYLYGAPDVGNGTSYTVSSLDPSGSYCFYVQAQNGCMPGSPSNVVCVNHSVPQVLGAVDNYNPVVSSIKSSYGGQVLGATTQLANTGDDSVSTAKLPSGNTLDAGHELAIPAIDVKQAVYLPQSIGDMLTIGHHEVLYTKLNGVQFYYGHNATDVFGHLYQVKLGDKIEITQNGRQFTYAVTATDFVSEDDVAAVKADTDQQIILMTCSYTQPDHRILVKASLLN